MLKVAWFQNVINLKVILVISYTLLFLGSLGTLLGALLALEGGLQQSHKVGQPRMAI